MVKKTNIVYDEETDLSDFEPEEIYGLMSFIQSISEELGTLGDKGEVVVDWDNRSIIARTENGLSKVFSFDDLEKHIKNGMN